ncbi:hypothetical protein EUTSA_v10027436mg [Eutrema salsugineum]|uniref:FAS1 domain-containing protein n=1 Tax=Eutrema salsugineum TaxID=72664 RepID=V4MMY6_EUTSA|nr:uncharacterized protein LOC18030895 [Eutrema salsugineum]ESQ54203.1 hypothetical protein EUTSA_v10027436mg [Eutrema salsugineum]
MKNLGFLLFLSSLAVAQAVDIGSRKVEDTARDIIISLANTKFQEWSAAFISTNDKTLGEVLRATLFIPNASSSATEKYNGDRRVAAYHVVPEKMEFNDLLAKKDKTRVSTLLGGFSILVRNTSQGGLTLDGVNLTEPDIFVNSFMAIHRISHPLDFTKYGTSDVVKPKSQLPSKAKLPPKSEFLAFMVISALICFTIWFILSRR